jgi:hypothetical protein
MASSFWDNLAKAAKSDAGQAVVSGTSAAYDQWVGEDDGDIVVKSSSIMDEPWFWPAVIVGGVVVLALVMKR